jgi:phosphatidylglycerophosphatase A
VIAEDVRRSAPPPTGFAGLSTRAISTFFYVGMIPFGPGTWASGITLALWLLLHPAWPVVAVATAAVIVIGTWASHRAEAIYGHDSNHVVIDEVAGVLIAVVGFAPDKEIAVAAFLLFRFFDIVKPPPIYQIQSLRGGLGVMADDVLAGIASNVVLRVILIVLTIANGKICTLM